MVIVLNNKTVFTGSTSEGNKILEKYLNNIFVSIVSRSPSKWVLSQEKPLLGSTPWADRTRGC